MRVPKHIRFNQLVCSSIRTANFLAFVGVILTILSWSVLISRFKNTLRYQFFYSTGFFFLVACDQFKGKKGFNCGKMCLT